MTAATPAKPSYLGLLNAISNGESGAGVFLSAWADASPHADLARALRFVAGRETAHGDVFRQRVERLGFVLRPAAGMSDDATAFFADPAVSDAEKIARASRDDDNASAGLDRIAALIDDQAVDALTRATLTWYVAEERDSIDLLRAAYAEVRG
jgi:hypothetical protein